MQVSLDAAGDIKVEYVCSLSHHQTAVNCLRFSPSGVSRRRANNAIVRVLQQAHCLSLDPAPTPPSSDGLSACLCGLWIRLPWRKLPGGHSDAKVSLACRQAAGVWR